MMRFSEQCVLYPESIQPWEFTGTSEQLTLLSLFAMYSCPIRHNASLFFSNTPCMFALVAFMTCPLILSEHFNLGWPESYPYDQQ